MGEDDEVVEVDGEVLFLLIEISQEDLVHPVGVASELCEKVEVR